MKKITIFFIHKQISTYRRITKFKNACATVGWSGSYVIPKRIFFSERGHITNFTMKMH